MEHRLNAHLESLEDGSETYAANDALELACANPRKLWAARKTDAFKREIGAQLVIIYHDKRYYAIVDAITSRGIWIAVMRECDGRHFYQLLQSTDEVYAAPDWLLFPSFNLLLIALMREDQLMPERDEEFVRVVYSGVTK